MELPEDVYKGIFLISPNETEAAMLTGIEIENEPSIKKAAAIFKMRGVQNVIITLGKKGAYADTEGFEGFVEPIKVNAIDTTAAGDIFNGALVAGLSEGKQWREALEFACKAASISVTKMGAQSSAPTKNEVMNYVHH
jgi:ribokinase